MSAWQQLNVWSIPISPAQSKIMEQQLTETSRGVFLIKVSKTGTTERSISGQVTIAGETRLTYFLITLFVEWIDDQITFIRQDIRWTQELALLKFEGSLNVPEA